MEKGTDAFRHRYGSWGVVVGATEGIGAEFARELAARGLNVALVARREEVLRQTGEELRRAYGIQVLAVSLDMAEADSVDSLVKWTTGLEVGLLVCSAAVSPIGSFLSLPRPEHERLVAVNCRTPALLAWEYGRAMAQRGRGGIILLSSMSGFQGTGSVAHYSASKAYVRVLAEGLWKELHSRGVHAIACCPGIVSTPTYHREQPVRPGWLPSPLMECAPVVARTLRALGRRPVVVREPRTRLPPGSLSGFCPEEPPSPLRAPAPGRCIGAARTQGGGTGKL